MNYCAAGLTGRVKYLSSGMFSWPPLGFCSGRIVFSVYRNIWRRSQSLPQGPSSVFFYAFGRKSQESWHQSGQELRMRESGCQGARAKPLTRALFCSDRGLLCVCVCMHLYISVYLCCQQTSSLTPTHPRCVWKHPAIRIKRCRRKDSLKRLTFLPNSSVCVCVNSFLLSFFTPFCISNKILCWRNTLLIQLIKCLILSCFSHRIASQIFLSLLKTETLNWSDVLQTKIRICLSLHHSTC